MSNMHAVTARSWRWGALLMGAISVSSAWASDEELPLFLSLSQSMTRDTNLLRDDANRKQDYISSTSLSGGINKAYGRQNYRLTAEASHHDYKHNSQYNNDGYALSGAAESELGSDFKLSLSGASSRFLPNFENQTDRSVRNIQTNKQYAADLRYGLYGRWSTNATVSRTETRYNYATWDNKTSVVRAVGLRFMPSDLVYFGTSLSRSDTDVPNRVLVGVAAVGEKIERTSLGFNTYWVVTGFSRLSGSLAVTNENHPADKRRNFKGVTGSAAWNYTPGGKMSYALTWVRNTSNEGGQTLGQNINADSVFSTNNRLTNTFTGSARWQATAKVGVNAAYTHALYQEDYGVGTAVALTNSSVNGRYNGLSLGVSYQPIRSVDLGCDAQRYDRTRSTFSRAYSGNALTCRASFTID